MSTKELLLYEIENAPEPLLSEVLDFFHFLKAKTIRQKLDISVMSESSLEKDWLKPEEDTAWKNL
jgi:hypothetical protein